MSGKKSIQFRPGLAAMPSGPGAIVIAALLLSWAIPIRVEAQATTLSAINSGQSQPQSGSENSSRNQLNSSQSSAVSGESALPAPGTSAITPGSGATLKRRLTRGPAIAIPAASSSLCFQPGVGWLQRPQPAGAVTAAFNTVPLPRIIRAARAQKLSGPVDSEDCTVSTLAAGASSSASTGAANADPALSAQGAGATINASASVSPGPSTQAPPAAAGGSKTQGRLPSAVLQTGSSESSYSYSTGLEATPLSIRPTVSTKGEIMFSIASPKQDVDQAAGAPQSTSVEVPIYLFSPGKDRSASSSASGERGVHVSQSALQSERNRLIGYESEELKSQEKSASVETPILGKDLHEYRQLRNMCQKVVQAQEAGALPDNLTLELSSSPKATELARLGADCGKLLAMDRGAVIKKMQKHKGMK